MEENIDPEVISTSPKIETSLPSRSMVPVKSVIYNPASEMDADNFAS
jgi:hypothetical protein